MTIPETIEFSTEFGKVGRLRRPAGRVVRAHSIRQPSGLGAAPAFDAGALGIVGGDVDLDADHLEIAGAVDRRNAAIGAVELRIDQAAPAASRRARTGIARMADGGETFTGALLAS